MRTIALKNIISFLLLTLSLTACHSPAYISGKLQGTEMKDIKVYIIELST